MSLELSHYKANHKKTVNLRFLHKKKSVRLIDKCVMVVGILSPLSSTPQILQIIADRDASGVSTLTWAIWAFMALFWLVYGIAHREKVIIASNIMWILVESTVVILTFIF